MSVNWNTFDLQTWPQIYDFWVESEAWALLLAALAAGFIDSIGGGGGLITVPALLNLGVPLPLLLGTNKCLSTFGSLPAVVRYTSAGLLPDLQGRVWVLLFLLAALVASAGAMLSQQKLLLEQLHVLIPILLFFVIAFMLKRWFWDEARQKNRSPRALHDFDSEVQIQKRLFHPAALSGLFGIACYDGVLGPGTGSFFLSLFEHIGLKTITANAMTKIFNLASNIGALIFFAFQGKVIWMLGFCAAAFYLCGSYLGSGLVLKRGQKLIRLVVVLASTSLLLKHLSQYF